MGGVSQGDSLKIRFDGDWYFWLLGRGEGVESNNLYHLKVIPKKEVISYPSPNLTFCIFLVRSEVVLILWWG